MSDSSPFAYQLNQTEAGYLSLLLGIIESQNWEALGCAIYRNPTAFQLFARNISIVSELNGMTILHACARFNPPAPIVKVLLELLPESPIFVDWLNRTPLHVAAGTRANFTTIQLLVDAYPKACAILDTDGKTPLHLACDSACTLFMGDEGRERDLPNTDLVSMMIEAWPSAVPWEDNYGTSALEYAILSGAPIEVVRLLQAVTCHQTKKQAQQVRSTNSRRVSQDSYDCQQQHHPAIASEPSEQEPNAAFDGAASTTTSMPARDGHLPSRRRGGILL